MAGSRSHPCARNGPVQPPASCSGRRRTTWRRRTAQPLLLRPRVIRATRRPSGPVTPRVRPHRRSAVLHPPSWFLTVRQRGRWGTPFLGGFAVVASANAGDRLRGEDGASSSPATPAPSKEQPCTIFPFRPPAP